MTISIDVCDVLDQHAHNHNLPTWLRITYWAQARADHHGRAPAYPGELRDLLGCNSHEVSRAIRLAKERHLLDEASSAGCLVLTGWSRR